MTGTVYLVPNTLGALDAALDAQAIAAVIPPRVREVAAALDYYLVENAKTARVFLKAIGTRLPIQQIEMQVLDKNTPAAELDRLLAPALAGRDIGVLSEAGCPAIADPGTPLVRLAHAKSLRVRPLVGPSSILLTVMGSGLSGQSFAFVGYLPSDPGARAQRLKELEERSRREQQTQVCIETPYRNAALLEAMATTLHPTTEVCVGTDLTLATESIQTLPAAQWRGRGTALQKRPTVFALLAPPAATRR